MGYLGISNKDAGKARERKVPTGRTTGVRFIKTSKSYGKYVTNNVEQKEAQ